VTPVLAFLIMILSLVMVLLVPALTPRESAVLCGPMTAADAAQAVLVYWVLAGVVALLISRSSIHAKFLLNLFLAALLVRTLVAAAIFVFNGQAFLGGDAYTYDAFGFLQVQGWHGDVYSGMVAHAYVNKAGTGWGMIYLVAGIYELIGRNMLATQLINAVLGAATAPLIYLSAWSVFEKARVARIAAFAVAFLPSLVLWSSQGLKDGPIMFFLALAILATLKLSEKVTLWYLLMLLCALLCVLAFRFYVFYMLLMAIVGSLVIGSRAITYTSLARQFVLLLLLTTTMSFCAAVLGARKQFEMYGSLKQVQVNRLDAATSANSGFGQDIDVSTAAGAVSAVPQGLVYLLFAPFPWQLGSVRQAISIPEMLLWWLSFPILILGVWCSMKHRFRRILPILIFTIVLTLAYSVFQGNIGNAYRQRAQLLIFYYIFISAGFDMVRPGHATSRPAQHR
jgi:4-amino-4-deoxy-L-arabinose transferase-like glycosyltransferase